MKMKYSAVIFDMDGVLIDSEYFYLNRIYLELVKNYPWIRREELFPTVGMSAPEDRELLHRLAKISPEDEDFDKEIERVYGASKIEDFNEVLYPEVPGVLRRLREEGYQIALASSSPFETIQRMLRQCGLEQYFESVISGEQLAKSKPNPEIYLKTMERLHRKPQECLVVEDSTYGVRAGAAAGACVAARLDKRFCFDQSKASYFIRTLEDLWEILYG